MSSGLAPEAGRAGGPGAGEERERAGAARLSCQNHGETSQDVLEMLSFAFLARSKKGGSKTDGGRAVSSPKAGFPRVNE